MALSQAKQAKLKHHRRLATVQKFWSTYPFIWDANWESDIRHYLETGRLVGMMKKKCGGRTDVES